MNATLKLIEKQIAMSDIRNRLEETAPQPGRYVTEDGVAFGPCLLISRECGSGGSLLGQRVGERLGWNVFDARIVDEIAQLANVHQRLVQSVDERVRSHWERTWRDILLDDQADEKYLRHLKQVVMALAHHGNVVFVGRGAQFLLPSQCALRVRLVAPLETRIHRLTERLNLSPEQARLKIKRVDTERAAFVWKIFKKDVGATLNHDLLVNTDEINAESVTELVLVAMERKLGVHLQPAFAEKAAPIR
ncbi:MAG TPA: cytidylate kinase-like family protein [Candidatus Aquilonibacter sp.]|nr:cytidylate kinase-like family protein [Candidatus Aquilonibacter sp.]